MILSVSRRTDIPAFYPDWFMNRVREGFVYVRNPFNINQISNIPLTPDVVDCIVFWTKNAEPIIKYLPEISVRYDNTFYFQYTINDYGKEIEPKVPDLDKRIDSFRQIADIYGKDHVIWRYDPIFLSKDITVEWQEETFKRLFEQIKDYTDTCVISFIDMYDRTKRNTRDLGIYAPNADEMYELAGKIALIAKGSGVAVKTCAESIDLAQYGIEHNSCIDQARIEKICGWKIKTKQDNQRENCHCIECADIGIYNTCRHGCKYCYATYNSIQVQQAVAAHDDCSPLLTGSVDEKSVIKEYSKARSLKVKPINEGQIGLFD